MMMKMVYRSGRCGGVRGRRRGMSEGRLDCMVLHIHWIRPSLSIGRKMLASIRVQVWRLVLIIGLSVSYPTLLY